MDDNNNNNNNNNNDNDNNSNMMYSACAWKSMSSVEQGGYCRSSHINQLGQQPKASSSSWAVPTSLYDHSSLLECARCTQGSYRSYGGQGGVGQGSNIMDGEIQYFEEEEEMCMGMEMKMMKKRKLTSEQARQLEASFEADKKLEADKKQRLADQLGLQPRQVAVWFQNRRARSKTKQLEIDFLALKSEYDRVLAQRHALQAEIARLATQLQDKASGTKVISCSQESTSSTNSNNGDLISESTTLQIKMHTSTKEKDELPSNSCQENERNKESTTRLPDLSSKYPNISNYDWAHPYDDGLWVFD